MRPPPASRRTCCAPTRAGRPSSSPRARRCGRRCSSSSPGSTRSCRSAGTTSRRAGASFTSSAGRTCAGVCGGGPVCGGVGVSGDLSHPFSRILSPPMPLSILPLSGADIIELATKDKDRAQWPMLHGLLENAIYGGRVDNISDAKASGAGGWGEKMRDKRKAPVNTPCTFSTHTLFLHSPTLSPPHTPPSTLPPGSPHLPPAVLQPQHGRTGRQGRGPARIEGGGADHCPSERLCRAALGPFGRGRALVVQVGEGERAACGQGSRNGALVERMVESPASQGPYLSSSLVQNLPFFPILFVPLPFLTHTRTRTHTHLPSQPAAQHRSIGAADKLRAVGAEPEADEHQPGERREGRQAGEMK